MNLKSIKIAYLHTNLFVKAIGALQSPLEPGQPGSKTEKMKLHIEDDFLVISLGNRQVATPLSNVLSFECNPDEATS